MPGTGAPQLDIFTPDSFNSHSAFDRYKRTYTYDNASNLTHIHQTNAGGTPSGWTIDKWGSPTSNRQAERLRQ